MKKILLSLVLTAFLFPAIAQESGIRFFHGTWEEAIALAKKEKKPVFIDFFTEWCGPCLNMALTIFPLPQVGDVYNKNFVCLKIDAEKGEGKELAQKYGVYSYPSYIFVNPKTQELIHRSGGNKSAADFIADADGALDVKHSSVYLDKKYKSGRYDVRFLMEYIRSQRISGNRDLENDFAKLLEMGCELTDKEVWELFCKCISGYRNPYIQQISDNYQRFVELFGKKAVDAKLAEATVYAPVNFIENLCDFEGKYYNMQMVKLTELFRDKKYDEAWEMADKLIADPKIDKVQFVKQLSFYTRINPKYQDNELTFEQLVNKIKYTRYVAYNMYDRDDAYTHYTYAVALEYLIQRALQEGKQIPADLLANPPLGKQEYDMRHPLLKPKPKHR